LKFIDIILHVDRYLNEASDFMGPWLYVLLFAIVFCETGLVIMPFLPGDSLLFAVGALAASEGSELNLFWLGILLSIAAIVGDAINYAIGRYLGPKVFRSDSTWLLNKKHLLRAQDFYERYGGKAIILARFAPILRTFAPFVAGIGAMKYSKFLAFNIIGGVVWVWLFLGAGYLFGTTPIVKRNFQLVIFGIIVISLLPIAFEMFRGRKAKTPDEASESGSQR
jgi:membrane-associated protein